MSDYFKNLFQKKSEEARQRRAEQSRHVEEAKKTKQEIDSTSDRINDMVEKLKKVK